MRELDPSVGVRLAVIVELFRDHHRLAFIDTLTHMLTR
jgi:hypothetical protein